MRMILWLLVLASAFVCSAQNAELLSGTQPLVIQGDLSAQMVAGIHRHLDAELAKSLGQREQFWHVVHAFLTMPSRAGT